MRTQLLCTFTRQTRLNETIDIIISCNEILYDKIYVFQNQQDLTQLICTYNVEFIDNYEDHEKDTMKKVKGGTEIVILNNQDKTNI